mmetsp:Transcript_32220/g.102560  ORF Transcript_32220/g.102560 Transcript_32220/m.102560 type:complete len:218 (+) Transcript_32220:58-711(+)
MLSRPWEVLLEEELSDSSRLSSNSLHLEASDNRRHQRLAPQPLPLPLVLVRQPLPSARKQRLLPLVGIPPLEDSLPLVALAALSAPTQHNRQGLASDKHHRLSALLRRILRTPSVNHRKLASALARLHLHRLEALSLVAEDSERTPGLPQHSEHRLQPLESPVVLPQGLEGLGTRPSRQHRQELRTLLCSLTKRPKGRMVPEQHRQALRETTCLSPI